jgi:fibronectin-binding autotransporter adhesin
VVLMVFAFIAWLPVFLPLLGAAEKSSRAGTETALVETANSNKRQEAGTSSPLAEQSSKAEPFLKAEEDSVSSLGQTVTLDLRTLGKNDLMVDQAMNLFGQGNAAKELSETTEVGSLSPIYASQDFSDPSLGKSVAGGRSAQSGVSSGGSPVTGLAGGADGMNFERLLLKETKVRSIEPSKGADPTVEAAQKDKSSEFLPAPKSEKKVDDAAVVEVDVTKKTKAADSVVANGGGDDGTASSVSKGSLIEENGSAEFASVIPSSEAAGSPLPLAPPPTSRTWTGSSTTAWHTASNWSSSSIPNSAEIALFASNTSRDPSIGSTPTTVGRLDFVPGTDAETLSGSAVLTFAGLEGFGVKNSSVLTHSISVNVALADSQTWESQGSGAGGIVFNNPIALSTHSLTVETALGNSIALGTGGSDVISGTGGLFKSGAGTLTLGSGTNTYSGGTTISGGIVVPRGNASFGTGNIVVSAGEIRSTADRAFANPLQIAGNFTFSGNSGVDYTFSTPLVSGSGTVTVDNLTNSGTVTTLGFSGAGVNITGNIVLVDSATQLRSASTTGTQTFSGQISGAGSFSRQTSGGITLLSGANTHSGGTSITSGTLQLGHDSAAGTGTLTLGSATLVAQGGARVLANAVTLAGTTTFATGNDVEFTGAATLTGNRTLNVQAATTFSGSIGESGGSRSLSKSGTGILRLGSANTFGGGVTVSQGGLLVGHNAALGTGSLNLNSAGIGAYGGGRLIANSVNLSGNATFLAGDALTFAGTAVLTGNRTLSILNSTTFSGIVSQSGGSRSLTKAGTGTLTLSGANTYSGTTTLSAGILNAGHNSAFGTGSLVLSGGTLGAIGGSRTLANNVSLAGNPTFAAGDAITFNGTATMTGNRTLNVLNTTTFNGVIGQSGGTRGLTKSGSGTLVLTRSNTFSGGTTLTAGTLSGHHNQAFGTGLLILAGGTLEGGNGSRTFANSIRIQANTTIGGASPVALSGAVRNEGGDHALQFTNSAPTSITGAVTLAENNAARSLTFDVDSTSGGVTLSGLIQPGTGSGADTFVKSGGGELTLATSQTLVGMFVLGGGTLSLGGVYHQIDTLGVEVDSVLSFGGTASILDLDYFSAQPGSHLTVRNWTSGADKIMAVHNPGAANLGRISFEGYGAGAMWVGNEIVPIPEPGSASIAALFLISLALIRKRP